MKYLVATAALAAVGASVCLPAAAFNGCKVILCLADAWQSIPECVPDVREALRCIARGRCWPTCANAPGVTLAPASGASCPPQYGIYENDACGRQVMVGCTKNGVIDVAFQGMPSWVRGWLSTADGSEPVMQYSDAAQAYLGENASPQFDMDYAGWVTTQPQLQPPPLCSDGNG